MGQFDILSVMYNCLSCLEKERKVLSASIFLLLFRCLTGNPHIRKNTRGKALMLSKFSELGYGTTRKGSSNNSIYKKVSLPLHVTLRGRLKQTKVTPYQWAQKRRLKFVHYQLNSTDCPPAINMNSIWCHGSSRTLKAISTFTSWAANTVMQLPKCHLCIPLYSSWLSPTSNSQNTTFPH